MAPCKIVPVAYLTSGMPQDAPPQVPTAAPRNELSQYTKRCRIDAVRPFVLQAELMPTGPEQLVRLQGQQQQQLLAEHRQLLSLPTQSPSPYLLQAVDSLLEQLSLLCTTKAELQGIVPMEGRGGAAAAASLENLPEVLRCVHEYFIQVAARVARLVHAAGLMRRSHMRAREAAGDYFDPFVDADRREEAAASAAVGAAAVAMAEKQGGAWGAAGASDGTSAVVATGAHVPVPPPASTESIFGVFQMLP
jgi:hypothetical protein